MSKTNWIKILGLAASIIGAGASLLSDYVKNRELDAKIAEKVSEALNICKKES